MTTSVLSEVTLTDPATIVSVNSGGDWTKTSPKAGSLPRSVWIRMVERGKPPKPGRDSYFSFKAKNNTGFDRASWSRLVEGICPLFPGLSIIMRGGLRQCVCKTGWGQRLVLTNKKQDTALDKPVGHNNWLLSCYKIKIVFNSQPFIAVTGITQFILAAALHMDGFNNG